MEDIAAGLEGVVVAATRLSEVDGERGRLIIGGYPVEELAPHAHFEEVLFLHPDILEAAVFGIPDEKWIEAVTAVIVPRPGTVIEIDAIHAHCRTHLAAFKCPKSIHLTESLPKNASGKILKREIRGRFAEANLATSGA